MAENKNLNDNSKCQENNEKKLISIENNNNINDSNQASNNIQEPLLNNTNIKIYPNPNEISSSNIENKTNQQDYFFVPSSIVNNEDNQNFFPNNNNYQAKEINQKKNDDVIQSGIVYRDPYTNSQMKYQVNARQNIPLRVQQRKRPWGLKDFLAILVGFALGVGTICLFYVL